MPVARSTPIRSSCLEGIEETLDALADRARLVLVTKGDLFHQEAKLAASGLGERFSGIEIVSDKKPATFKRIFDRFDVLAGSAADGRRFDAVGRLSRAGGGRLGGLYSAAARLEP